MTYLIGTDEAGYGPNLGPLVVTATAWRVPVTLDHHGLYDALRDVVSPERPQPGCRRLWLADSKRLYHPGGGIKHLERGVLSALAEVNQPIQNWQQLSQTLCPSDQPEFRRSPWLSRCNERLPVDNDAEDIDNAVRHFSQGLKSTKIRLLRVQSRVITADQFNRLLLDYGNKSSILSFVTLDLIRRLMQQLPPAPVRILCDKHGGRNKYGPLLQSHFDDFVEVRGESRGCSLYRWGPSHRRVEIRFQTKADNILAAALASMVSKYVREIAMRSF